MILSTLCLAAISQAVQIDPAAGALVSKMLAKYSAANSMVGNVRYTVSGTKAGVDTMFQFEKPNKLYVLQSRFGSEPKQWLVVCDGKKFGYPVPERVYGGGDQRLYESAIVNGRALDLKEIYRVIGSSLGDRNIALDVSISRVENLRFLRNQWASMTVADSAEGVSRLVGNWRETSTSPVSGNFEMWITSEGDLKKYIMRQTLKPDPALPAQTVESTWDIDLKVDAKCDSMLFNLR